MMPTCVRSVFKVFASTSTSSNPLPFAISSQAGPRHRCMALLDLSFARPFCASLGRAYVTTLVRRKVYGFRVDNF